MMSDAQFNFCMPFIILKGCVVSNAFSRHIKKPRSWLHGYVVLNLRYFFFLKSPRFQALMNWFQAKGLKMFCGGSCPV